MPPKFRITPFTAFTMLCLFAERKLDLTEEQFDCYFDEVLRLLERTNNEKYRLIQKEKPCPDAS